MYNEYKIIFIYKISTFDIIFEEEEGCTLQMLTSLIITHAGPTVGICS